MRISGVVRLWGESLRLRVGYPSGTVLEVAPATKLEIDTAASIYARRIEASFAPLGWSRAEGSHLRRVLFRVIAWNAWSVEAFPWEEAEVRAEERNAETEREGVVGYALAREQR